MKRIHGHRGDWYGADYTIGDDPVVKYTKVKIKGGAIESQVMAAVAKELGIDIALIKDCHIVRMDS